MKKTILLGLILLYAVNVFGIDFNESINLNQGSDLHFWDYYGHSGYMTQGINGLSIRAYGTLGVMYNDIRMIDVDDLNQGPGLLYVDEQGYLSIIPIDKICHNNKMSVASWR